MPGIHLPGIHRVRLRSRMPDIHRARLRSPMAGILRSRRTAIQATQASRPGRRQVTTGTHRLDPLCLTSSLRPSIAVAKTSTAIRRHNRPLARQEAQ
jgi:hypothetical protein